MSAPRPIKLRDILARFGLVPEVYTDANGVERDAGDLVVDGWSDKHGNLEVAECQNQK